MGEASLRMRDVCARFGVQRWTIHRWIRELNFPAGKQLVGVKGARWTAEELDQWEAANTLPLGGDRP